MSNAKLQLPAALGVYRRLHTIGLRRSYAAKFLFTAFIGTHIPLIGLVVYAFGFQEMGERSIEILLLVLGYTLIATAITLFVVNRLLAPVKLASQAMNHFKEHREVLDLPQEFNDEAGVLLSDIRTTLQEVKQLSADRRNFSGLITHDLRNQLGNVVGLAQIAEETEDIHQLREYIRLMQQAGEGGLAIISDTLALMEAETFSIDDSDLSPVAVHYEVAKLVRESNAARKQVNVNVQIGDQYVMHTHPTYFKHIAQNLLANAIKFSEPGSTVTISAATNGRQNVFEVVDQGVGFAAEAADALFDKFTKQRRQGTAGEATSGLGLHLTKMLVEKLGGTITAHSDGPGTGARFTVQLPQ
jgi:signal transduction histidine kinase